MPNTKLRRILLLDDDPTVNFLNQLLIEEMDLCGQLDIFTEAGAALRFLEKLLLADEAANWPELILVDVNMVGMDGFEFLDRYRALPGKKGQVVMLTSSNYPRDLQKAHQYGITAYLTKPLTEEELARLVAQERQ